MDEQKLTLQEEIESVLHTYIHARVPRDITQRIKQIVKHEMQQVIEQTVKRSILRDAFTNQLDQKDLLSIVQRLGPKYKTAIGYHLIKKELTNVKTADMAGGIQQEQSD